MEYGSVVPITVFVAVLCLCLIIGHLLEENRWLNESITAIFIGCLSGIVILLVSKWRSSHILRFDEELFFIYLLPPIIFNAGDWNNIFLNGYSVYAAGWLMLVLHQDETPLLYSLVFGEGVVNDATTVVLFNAVQKLDVSRLDALAAAHVFGDFLYLFSTSTILGVGAGLLTSYVLKGLYFGKHSSVREIALMMLMPYLSYMLAELLHLSGILAVFFCGIVMSHYAWHNITETSRITTRHVFAAMSFIAETFIFLYVGMDALDIEKWKMSKLRFGTSLGICSTLMLLICLGRAAFVFPLSALSNHMNRNAGTSSSTITFKHQVVIWWAGLMRGAVSIALAFKQFTYSGVTSDPINATMVTITIIIVLFSTIVFGTLTKPLINCLLPRHPHDSILHREPTSAKEDLTLPLLSFDESTSTNIARAKESFSMLMESPVYTIHYYWRKFDDCYMRPIFGAPRSDSGCGVVYDSRRSCNLDFANGGCNVNVP
ncbi:hypothetical protein RHGRI_018724 [Rhododendron griersonianum]|uniref:Cation/H+ exchanger transmembrane domain-containing protein n=1 Tax=Rhododendron griersonianum TaxID=479676 RepID=A0AAV6K2H1_9ERIC|nr:hypothetical protein RHGRI_018724 [Rhododendron griersonianum]